jgi:multiple sugar transport system permease protein
MPRKSPQAVTLTSKALLYLILSAIAITMVTPLLWTVSTSLKPDVEIFSFPPKFIPKVWRFDNYLRAWKAANFERYFFNSTVVAVGGTLLTLAICSLAGYTFARLEFIGREFIFWFVLSSMMIPGAVTLIPVFIIVKSIPLAGGNDIIGSGGTGWLNTFWGLIVPGAGGAFGTFMLRQFFRTLPQDLIDAARIDGSSEFRILWQIMIPLSKPALTTLAIFTFQGYWNDFTWPLVATFTNEMRTIQLGLTVFRQRFTTDWGALMSGVTMAIIPMIVLFLLAQKYFIQGIALTGIKG